MGSVFGFKIESGSCYYSRWQVVAVCCPSGCPVGVLVAGGVQGIPPFAKAHAARASRIRLRISSDIYGHSISQLHASITALLGARIVAIRMRLDSSATEWTGATTLGVVEGTVVPRGSPGKLSSGRSLSLEPLRAGAREIGIAQQPLGVVSQQRRTHTRPSSDASRGGHPRNSGLYAIDETRNGGFIQHADHKANFFRGGVVLKFHQFRYPNGAYVGRL